MFPQILSNAEKSASCNFIFVDSGGIGSVSESSCSPIWTNSDSNTSHSAPVPSPVESGIESESELGRYSAASRQRIVTRFAVRAS